jgi:hypothetical protein
MAELTVNAIQKVGTPDIDADLTAADVAGDSYKQSSGTFIMMSNADASPHTLTVAAIASTTDTPNLGALDVENIVLTVGAGKVGLVSVPSGYTDADGNYSWTYDDVTAVTIGVFSIAP